MSELWISGLDVRRAGLDREELKKQGIEVRDELYYPSEQKKEVKKRDE